MTISPADSTREDELRTRVEYAVAALQRASAESDGLFALSRLNNPERAFDAQRAAVLIRREAEQRLRTALRDFEAFTRGS